MKCRTCNTGMVVDHCESSQYATTCWHHCPLCKQVRLTSEETNGALAQLAQVAHTDDDGGYPSEFEHQSGNAYLSL
ncbi:MAG: hypothetical protein AB8B79_10040 [Granulosicoccus sp.]